MLSVLDSITIIDEAEALAAEHDFQALRQLLAATPAELISSDPTLLFLLAFAQYSTGNEFDAYRKVCALLVSYSGDRGARLYRRVLNLRAILEVELGNLVEADALFVEVQSAAELVGDQRYIAYGTLNRGIILEIHGLADQAIVAFERARIAFQRMGDEAGAAGCAHNLGMAYRRLGEFTIAENQFSVAMEHFTANGSVEELLSSTIERALVLSLNGEMLLGGVTAKLALDAAEDLQNPRLCGEAARVVGKTAILMTDWGVAYEMLDRARRIGQENRLRLLEAEALTDLATVSAAIGNDRHSYQLVTAAAEMFESMGATSRAHELRNRH